VRSKHEFEDLKETVLEYGNSNIVELQI